MTSYMNTIIPAASSLAGLGFVVALLWYCLALHKSRHDLLSKILLILGIATTTLSTLLMAFNTLWYIPAMATHLSRWYSEPDAILPTLLNTSWTASILLQFLSAFVFAAIATKTSSVDMTTPAGGTSGAQP